MMQNHIKNFSLATYTLQQQFALSFLRISSRISVIGIFLLIYRHSCFKGMRDTKLCRSFLPQVQLHALSTVEFTGTQACQLFREKCNQVTPCKRYTSTLTYWPLHCVCSLCFPTQSNEGNEKQQKAHYTPFKLSTVQIKNNLVTGCFNKRVVNNT